jgi:hypothetical protein
MLTVYSNVAHKGITHAPNSPASLPYQVRTFVISHAASRASESIFESYGLYRVSKNYLALLVTRNSLRNF